MTISAISSSSPYVPPPTNQLRQAFRQMTGAIQSGDLSAAQSAYATLSQAGSGDPNSPFTQALNQIGNALQSGDIGQAQQALASLQQQMQATKGAHHHGHHHHGGGVTQSQPAPATASSDQSTSTASSSLVDVTA